MREQPAITLNDGTLMPLIGLGTYKLKGKEMENAVDAALSSGYRLFDTAVVYGNEKDLGEALEVCLPKYSLSYNDIFIITKVYIQKENTAEKVSSDVENSLKNLKARSINLVLIHYPKSSDSSDEDAKNEQRRRIAWQRLEELRAQGKIGSIGVSNYEIKHINEIQSFGKLLPSVNQIEVQPHFCRTELRNFCKEVGIAIQAFSSLARHDKSLLEDPILREIAENYSCSPQNILLAWAVSQGIAIIPKSSSTERIQNNRKAASMPLTEVEISKLNGLDCKKNYVNRCTGWLVQ